MTTITITGLNDRQKNIMDLLWGCNDLEQVNTLIAALPSEQDRYDAKSLVEIALHETLEAEGCLDEYKADAELCISHAARS